MSKLKSYYFLILAVVFLTSCSLSANKENGNSGSGKKTNQKGSLSGSLKEMIAKNTPMKCKNSVEADDGTGVIEGIIQGNQYIGRMSMNGKIGNILMKDNCMWSWQDGKTSGIKTCFETSEGDGGLMGNVDSGQLSANVNCSPTMITPGIFSPPANVSFLDMDEIGNGNLTPEQMKQLDEMSDE